MVWIAACPRYFKVRETLVLAMRDHRRSHYIDGAFKQTIEIYYSKSTVHTSSSQIDDCGRLGISGSIILKFQTLFSFAGKYSGADDLKTRVLTIKNPASTLGV
jgi:hypothetical protein